MKSVVLRAAFLSAILLMMAELPKLVFAQTPTPPRKFDKPSPWAGEEMPIPLHFSSLGLEAAASPLAPIGLEDWSRIVFQSYRDGDWEIYFGSIDGQNPVNVSNHPSADARPVLNRGATQIAFNSNRAGNSEIYIINVDGSGLTRLTNSAATDYAPAWSPDGNKIAFVSQVSENKEIYKVNKDGSGLTRLTNHSYDDFGPVWSPDGTRIAWIRYHDYFGSIWMMNADGTNPHAITDNRQYMNNIAWSPDGSYLAADCDWDLDEWNELVRVNTDGTNMHQIYDTHQAFVDSWLGSWSPDSQWIIFTRIEFAVEGNQLYINHAYLERIKPGFPSTDHSRLVGPGYEEEPDWQTLDITPPQSSVHPLPKYSRVGGIPVQWSGIDSGVSGLSSYDIQFRINSPGTWFNWGDNFNTTYTSDIFYRESPGESLYFRGRARDRSGNLEAWPAAADGDAWTRLFNWILQGSITDNQGKPIPYPAIQLSPSPWETPQTDYLGNFFFHLAASATHTLSASHAGYGALPISTLPMGHDTAYELVLPPQDNLIQNGEFEAGDLDFWQVNGSAQAEVYYPEPHSGIASLRLGYTPDIQITNLSDKPNQSFKPQVVRDPLGTLHAVWHDSNSDYGYGALVYSQQPPEGIWSPPVLISPGLYFDLAVGPDSTLHLVRTTSVHPPAYSVVYLSRPYDGVWSSPSDISGDFPEPAGGFIPSVAVDSLGDVHVIWEKGDHELMYATKPHGASWSAPVSLSLSGQEPELVVGKDDTLHLFWRNWWDLFYSSRPPGGVWSLPFHLSDSANHLKTMAVDDVGNIHLCWIGPSRDAIWYAWKPPSGSWSAPVIIAEDSSSDFITSEKIAVGPGGYLHLAWSTYYGKIYYRVRYPDGLWSIPLLFLGGVGDDPILWADDNGMVQMVWVEEHYNYLNTDVFHTALTHPESMDVYMSQFVQVPGTMHKPTLSFAYRLEPYDGSGAYLEFSVGNTPVLTVTNTSQDWSYAWADLSAWSGQTITLTLTAHGTSTGGYPFAQLDEISLGSWLTPVVTDASPGQLDAWASATITVTGDNFITTPVVYLEDIPIPGVTMSDEHTLHLTLPAELGPGIYDIWVENPGGQRGVLHAGLVLGKSTFLPLLAR